MPVPKVSEARTLAARVKELRAERGWTVAVLADISKMNISSISAVESGARLNPGLDTIVALAGAFRISVDELIGFDVGTLPAMPIVPSTIEGFATVLQDMRVKVAELEADITELRTRLDDRDALVPAGKRKVATNGN